MMLYEFLETHRAELIARCRSKATVRHKRITPPPPLEHGIPMLIGQLATTLREESGGPRDSSAGDQAIGGMAGRHGTDLLTQGFTIDQVVHDYGDLCQTITELAAEKRVEIAVDEFRTFNRCLDNAIAGAVTEFGRARDLQVSDATSYTLTERLGSLAHELRNHLGTAMLAFHAIKTGGVAVNGATGAVLGRSLDELRDLLDRSLADVRLTTGLHPRPELLSVSVLLAEVQVAAVLEATDRGLELVVDIDAHLTVEADRQMLYSAVANLMRNAFKFTQPRTHVWLRARSVDDRVLIEVEDECGGLPSGRIEELFQPFEQRSGDRTGVGLGLAISRRGVEANGGTLDVVDLPGKGCIFTISLPRSPR